MKENNKDEKTITRSIFSKKLNRKIIIVAIIIIAIILISIMLLREKHTNEIRVAKYAEGEKELISIEIYIRAINTDSYVCLLTFTSNDENEKIKSIEYPKEEGKETQVITVEDTDGKEKVGIDYEFKIDDIDKIFKVTTSKEEVKEIKTAYKVEYDLNGGEAEIPEQYGLVGNSITIPNITPGNEEKVFLGWSQEKDADTQEYNRGALYFGKNEVEKLYAVWEEGKGIVGHIAKDEVNKSGEYSIKRSGITYNFEVLYIDQNNIGEYGSYESSTNTYTITNNINLGTATESEMAVLKCDGNLIINSEVKITTSTYSVTSSSKVTGDVTKIKGMYIHCSGELMNNGTITQTARGTYDTAGENVYLWSERGNYEPFAVPAVGASGGAHTTNTAHSAIINGKPGQDGESRQTGGGGAGAYRKVSTFGTCRSGAGSQGTSYSGGSGGGAGIKLTSNSSGAPAGKAGALNGGSGGDGAQYHANAGGGAGNPGGAGKGSNGSNGATGTGGLLIVYADKLTNNGSIQANGVENNRSYGGPGGSSGGGSVNIFYTTQYDGNDATATGGARAINYDSGYDLYGGAGGNGCVTYSQISLQKDS